MTTAIDPRDPSDDAYRYAFYTRPRCPWCHSLDLQSKKTISNEDNCVSRRTWCRTCGHKFIVVAE